MKIDIQFEINTNVIQHKDPDSYSKILYDYHYILWHNKEIKTDVYFKLLKQDKTPYKFMYYINDTVYTLSSDAMIHTYLKWKSLNHLNLSYTSELIKEFRHLSLTIGGYIIFPSNKINNKPTINASRGMNPYIKDRFDLTLECIRRWYLNQESPLFEVINRYKDFFNAFETFKNYVRFFYLEPLINKDETIQFWLPINDFDSKEVIPKDLDMYKMYMENVKKFIRERNRLIEKNINE